MKLKLDADGHVVVQDGKPVYVQDDGKEVAFDAVGTVGTISRLNGEAKANRERAEAAETRLRPFEGIADPEAAIKALNTVKNLDDKKLVDAGEVERLKTELGKSYQTQIDEANAKSTTLEQQLYSEKVGGAFARSPLIVGDKAKLVIPPDLVEARFGKAFSIEDGKIVAKDQHGNKLYSKSNPGELASFDDALEQLVDAYPYKDQILKPSGAQGGGATGGGGGTSSHKPAGNLGGTREERVNALAAKFPELSKG